MTELPGNRCIVTSREMGSVEVETSPTSNPKSCTTGPVVWTWLLRNEPGLTEKRDPPLKLH